VIVGEKSSRRILEKNWQASPHTGDKRIQNRSTQYIEPRNRSPMATNRAPISTVTVGKFKKFQKSESDPNISYSDFLRTKMVQKFPKIVLRF